MVNFWLFQNVFQFFQSDWLSGIVWNFAREGGMKVHGVATRNPCKSKTWRKIRVGEVQNGSGYSWQLRFVNLFVVFFPFLFFLNQVKLSGLAKWDLPEGKCYGPGQDSLDTKNSWCLDGCLSYAPWRSSCAQKLVPSDLVAGKFYSTKLFSKTTADCWTVGSVFQEFKHWCLESGKRTEKLHFLVAKKKTDKHMIYTQNFIGVISSMKVIEWNSVLGATSSKPLFLVKPGPSVCYWPHHPPNIRFQVKWRRTLLVAVVGFMNGMRPGGFSLLLLFSLWCLYIDIYLEPQMTHNPCFDFQKALFLGWGWPSKNKGSVWGSR